jgi:hypothetical protein
MVRREDRVFVIDYVDNAADGLALDRIAGGIGDEEIPVGAPSTRPKGR